jgi:hypothetical protein
MSNQDQQQTDSRFKAALKPWLHWKRKRFWALFAILAYTLLGFLAVPWFVERTAINEFAAQGRTASAERVSANPFLLTLRAEGFELRDDDDTLILSYDDYLWNFQLSSLFRWAWTFKEVTIKGLYIHEERFGGLDTRYNRLIESFKPAEESVDYKASSGTPRIIIELFRMENGRFSLSDHVAGDFEGTFGPISVEISNLRTLPDHSGNQTVSISTALGGTVEWQGDIRFQPFASSGSFNISGQSLDDAFRYADYFLPFLVSDGQSEITFDYDFVFEAEGPRLALQNIEASFHETRVVPDGEDQPVFSSSLIELHGGEIHWPGNTVSIEAIQVSDPDLRITLDDTGRLSLLDLLPPTSQDTVDAASTSDAPPWQVALGRFDITGGTVRLRDETPDPAVELTLQDLRTGLSGIDIEDGTVMPLDTFFTLSSGGSLDFKGEITLLPGLSTHGQLVLEAVALPVAQPYLDPFVRIQLKSGTLGLDAELTSDGGSATELTGAMSIDGFEITDAVKQERLAAWNRMSIDHFELSLEGNSLQTSEVIFDQAYGRLHIAEDLSTNISDLLVATEASGDDDQSAENHTISIGGIKLQDAALDFSDFSLPLPFEAAIRSLQGEISTLSTTSSEPASVSMEGQVNEYGLARIEGEINAWAFTEQTDISMTFRNLEMARLTPYTVQFAGYAIEAGRLDLDLDYALTDRQLQGANSIVIRELTLGEKVDHPDAGSLPLGLAVALLKDSEGVIDIDLPVSGDLDDPEFKIGGVVMKAIGNMITKLVTAPFRLLGNLVGIDSEDFGTLEFLPGRSNVSPPDREKLVKLAEAMQQRPELMLEVSGVYASGPDSQALQVQMAEAALEAREAELPEIGDELSTSRTRRALESLYLENNSADLLAAIQAENSVPESEEEGAEFVLDEPVYLNQLQDWLVEQQSVSESELLDLANARSAAVMEVLLTAQPETGLNAAEAEAKSVEVAEGDTVPMELAVKAD